MKAYRLPEANGMSCYTLEVDDYGVASLYLTYYGAHNMRELVCTFNPSHTLYVIPEHPDMEEMA